MRELAISLRDRLSRTIGPLLGQRPGVQHARGAQADRDSATMVEKLDAALNSFEAAATIDAILGLGRALGLPVIAEGVETEEQRASLAKAGCGIQGYLIGRPEPIAHYQHLVTAMAVMREGAVIAG